MGLSFILPKQVTFAYQLSGLSQDWQAAGSRRTAYFSGLPRHVHLPHARFQPRRCGQRECG